VSAAKRSISFDPDVLNAATREAQHRWDGNLSALVNEALRRQLKVHGLRRLLDDWDEKFGPVPDDVQAEVDREWARLQGG
jgi:hypothetical protein